MRVRPTPRSQCAAKRGSCPGWNRGGRPERGPYFERGGCYLITGAFGRIGLAVAEHLVDRLDARLVLTGRRLPDGAASDASLRLARLRERGALCIAADAADAVAVRDAVDVAVRTHGGLDGVVHLAGITGEASFATIADTTGADLERHRRPKLAALRAVERAIDGRSVRFVCVGSSLAALLGGFGLAAYAAANRAADAFAAARDDASGTRWIAFDWDAWRFGPEDDLGRRPALQPADGVAALVALLERDVPARLVVGVREPELHAAVAAVAPPPAQPAEPGIGVAATLTAIWHDVLGGPVPSPNDDFFALGGDSLAALRVTARVRERLGVELPLRRFLDAPTIAGVAAAVLETRAAAAPATAQAPDAPAGDALRPVSDGQRRLWMLEHLSRGDARTMRVNVLELNGDVDLDALRRAFAAVVRRHDVLRTRIVTRGGTPWQCEAAGATAELAVLDLSGAPAELRAERAAAAVAEAAARPFDLAADTPLRGLAIRLAPQRHQLAVLTHHAVIDGWSTAILSADVGRLYSAFARGEHPSDDSAPRFEDAAAWERARLDDRRRDELVAWWRDELHGAPPVLDLAPGRPKLRRGGRPAIAPHLVGPAAAEAVRECARTERTSPFSVILGALAALLNRATGCDDVVVGTAVARREFPGADRTLGFFVNTVPIRIRLHGDPSLREVTLRARDALHGALAHQDLPFDELVSALAPARSHLTPPLVQILLVLQNVPAVELAFHGLDVRPIESERGAGQFDLVLDYADDPDGSGALRGWWEYDADRFTAAEIAGLQRRFDELLDDVTGTAGEAADALERTLARLWGEVLRGGPVPYDADFFALGGDSIAAIQFAEAARHAGLRVHPLDLFEHPVLADLAQALRAGGALEEAIEPVADGRDVPLTPIQAWYLDDDPVEPGLFAQAVSLEVDRAVETPVLRAALAELVRRHAALRHRFLRTVDGWRQHAAPDDAVAFETVDARSLADARFGEALSAEFAAAQARLDPEHGPLVAATHVLAPGEAPNRLLLAVHHLVVDGVSWRILLTDLAALVEVRPADAMHAPAAPAPSYAAWANHLARRIPASTRLDEDAAWWAAHDTAGVGALWTSSPPGTVADVEMLVQPVAPEAANVLLADLPLRYGASAEDLLLAALARALADAAPGDALILELEHHGRDALGERVDLARTVGWFTALFPMHLPLPRAGLPAAWVAIVRDGRKAHAAHGFAYLPLLHGARGTALAGTLAAAPPPEVGFNYLGRFASPGSGTVRLSARDAVPEGRSARAAVRLPLMVTAQVVDGELTVEWRFDRRRVDRAAIESLACRFSAALAEPGAPPRRLPPVPTRSGRPRCSRRSRCTRSSRRNPTRTASARSCACAARSTRARSRRPGRTPRPGTTRCAPGSSGRAPTGRFRRSRPRRWCRSRSTTGAAPTLTRRRRPCCVPTRPSRSI